MFSVFVLTSGSSGNSILFSNKKSSILIDCGLSGKELERRLDKINEPPEKIKGIIVTHEHSDHISGVGIAARRFKIPVFLKCKTLEIIEEKLNNVSVNIIEKSFCIDDFQIECFPVSHDAADPIGLSISNQGYKIGIATDLGFISNMVINKLSGCHGIIIESNYDDKMLIHGDRPLFLKQRIKSRFGHLSNSDAVKLVENIDKSNLKFIMLFHISEEHNSYELALKNMKNYLDKNGLDNIKLFACCQTNINSYSF